MDDKSRDRLIEKTEAALAEFLANGGQIVKVAPNRAPKPTTANGKNKGAKVLRDPTARWPKK
jgi:hypothetical protein